MATITDTMATVAITNTNDSTITMNITNHDTMATVTDTMPAVASTTATNHNTMATISTDDSAAVATKMAKLTLSVPLPMNQNHSSAKTLMGLPLELRNLIWHYTLVSPSKHSRGHSSDCQFRHGHTRTSIEPAACMVLERKFDPLNEEELYPWDIPKVCSCAKRRGLNLLLANRQVHHEAAPIFWTRNEFVFDHADEFTVCVGSRLREAYRPLLRNVYVAGPFFSETSKTTNLNLFTKTYLEHNIPRWTQFWGVLKQCVGLHRLAVRPELVKKHSADMRALTRRLPELQRFELTWLWRYKDQSVEYNRDWGNFRYCVAIQRDTIFVRASQAVEIRGENAVDLSPNGCKELFRNFTTNFCVYVDRIVRDQFLGCPDVEWVDFHGGRMAAGLDDLRPSYRVELPTGKTARITFMGLPQSRKTRINLAREMKARDDRLRAQGKPTAAEEKVLKEIQERKKEKKEQEEFKEQNDRDRVLQERRDKADRMNEEERREKKVQREEVMRAVAEEKVQRRLGRKRVTGTIDREETEEEEDAESEVRVVPRTSPQKVVKESKESKEKKSPGKKRGGGGGKGKGKWMSIDDLDDYELY